MVEPLRVDKGGADVRVLSASSLDEMKGAELPSAGWVQDQNQRALFGPCRPPYSALSLHMNVKVLIR